MESVSDLEARMMKHLEKCNTNATESSDSDIEIVIAEQNVNLPTPSTSGEKSVNKNQKKAHLL